MNGVGTYLTLCLSAFEELDEDDYALIRLGSGWVKQQSGGDPSLTLFHCLSLQDMESRE